MTTHETVHIECYTLVVEAVTAKDQQRITSAIGGVRNDEGRGHARGPFNLYENDEPVTQTISVQKDNKSARKWRVSVDNVEAGTFPVFHAEREIDIRKTRTITFVVGDGE